MAGTIEEPAGSLNQDRLSLKNSNLLISLKALKAESLDFIVDTGAQMFPQKYCRSRGIQ